MLFLGCQPRHICLATSQTFMRGFCLNACLSNFFVSTKLSRFLLSFLRMPARLQVLFAGPRKIGQRRGFPTHFLLRLPGVLQALGESADYPTDAFNQRVLNLHWLDKIFQFFHAPVNGRVRIQTHPFLYPETRCPFKQ